MTKTKLIDKYQKEFDVVQNDHWDQKLSLHLAEEKTKTLNEAAALDKTYQKFHLISLDEKVKTFVAAVHPAEEESEDDGGSMKCW